MASPYKAVGISSHRLRTNQQKQLIISFYFKKILEHIYIDYLNDFTMAPRSRNIKFMYTNMNAKQKLVIITVKKSDNTSLLNSRFQNLQKNKKYGDSKKIIIQLSMEISILRSHKPKKGFKNACLYPCCFVDLMLAQQLMDIYI